MLFTEGEISDFIDSTDAANTKKQIQFAVQRLESFAQLVDADLVDIIEPEFDGIFFCDTAFPFPWKCQLLQQINIYTFPVHNAHNVERVLDLEFC